METETPKRSSNGAPCFLVLSGLAHEIGEFGELPGQCGRPTRDGPHKTLKRWPEEGKDQSCL